MIHPVMELAPLCIKPNGGTLVSDKRMIFDPNDISIIQTPTGGHCGEGDNENGFKNLFQILARFKERIPCISP